LKDVMVVEAHHPDMNARIPDAGAMVRTIHRNYFFLDEKRATREKPKLYVVAVMLEGRRAKPTPISWTDFLDDTINPIYGKAKQLLGRRKSAPTFVDVKRTLGMITFVFAASLASKR